MKQTARRHTMAYELLVNLYECLVVEALSRQRSSLMRAEVFGAEKLRHDQKGSVLLYMRFAHTL